MGRRSRLLAARFWVGLVLLVGATRGGAVELPGATAGSFAVSDRGAAVYRIPIEVPPGTGGMAPELALTYSSSGSNGLLGVGWGLEGLSLIHRCPKTLATDGVYGKVAFSTSDQFCIDGDRLVHVGGSAHGQPGAEYRGEREIFTRVLAQGSAGTGPLWFEVRTKSGRILEYGNTPDSRLEKPGGGPEIQTWQLSKVSDRSGNFLTIAYAKDAVNGFIPPDRIEYTGNANASPQLEPYASVEFEYQTRTDNESHYAFGSPRSVPERLWRVRTYVGVSPGTLVREYRLGYEISNGPGQSRLISVTECAANGDCLRPTEVTWTTGATPTWTSVTTAATLPFDIDTVWLSGDVLGTGITDLVAVRSNSGNVQIRVFSPTATGEFASAGTTEPGWTWQEEDHWLTGDYDADGRADLLVYRGYSMPTLRVLRSVGDGSFIPLSPGTAVLLDWPTNGLAFSADGSGDNRSDFFMVHPLYRVDTYTGNGTGGFVPTYQFHGSPGFGPFVAGHFDGDGLIDVAKAYATELTGSDTIGAKTSGGVVSSLGYSATANRHHFTADVNGDGLSDIVSSLGGGSGIQVALALGNQKFADTPGSVLSGSWTVDDVWFPADLNGDACDDLIRVRPLGGIAQSHRWFSKCDGGFTSDYSNLGSWQPEDAWLVGDTDGDSFSDLIRVRKDGTNWTFVHHRSSGQARDLATGFETGVGTEDLVQYGTLADTAVHTKGTGTAYPIVDVVGASYVVTRHTESNGAAPARVFDYSYKAARSNLHGRGFLGFEEQTALEAATGRRTITRFRQDFPLDGLVVSQEVRTSPAPGTVLEDTVNTWGVVNLGGTPPRYRAELQFTTHRANELDGSTVVTTTTEQVFDSYGNPIEVSTTRDGGGAVFTDTTWVYYLPPDLTNWLIGIPDYLDTYATAPGVPTLARAVDLYPNWWTGLMLGGSWDSLTPFWSIRILDRDVFGNAWRLSEWGEALSARTTTLTFDPKGRYAEAELNAVDHEMTWVYDERFGVATSQEGPDPAVPPVGQSYDGLGRALVTTRPDGTTATVVRQNCTTGCPPGAVYLERMLASGTPTTTTYFDDRLREVSRRTVGFGGTEISVDTEYDGVGRLLRRSQPYYLGATRYWTQLQYDLLDRIQGITLPDPAPNQITADYDGLTVTVTDPLGRLRSETRDARGNLVELLEGLGALVAANTYAYDAHSNPTAIVDSNGNTITQTWDAKGRRTSMNDPDLGYWTFQYNAGDVLNSQTDANNQTTNFTYDAIDRPLTRSEVTDTTTWTWDTAAAYGRGQLGQVATSNTLYPIQRSHSYDSFGRPLSATTTVEGVSYSVKLAYDAQGRVTVVTYPAGLSGTFAVQNVYNANHHLERVKKSGAATPVYWQATAMSPFGQVSSETLENGLTTQRAFDLRTGRLQSITTGAGSVQSLLYDWDVLGRLESREDLRQPVQTKEVFGYDALDRLTSVTGTGAPSKTYGYDLAGNLTYKSDLGTPGTLTYPPQGPSSVGPHRVISAAGASYYYDLNGNQSSANHRTVSYTSFNKPLAITRFPDTLVSSSFAYGPDRELVRTWERDATGPAVRIHIGDLYERSTRGTYVEHRYYVRAGDALVAIHKDTSSGPELRYVHRDHLGSTDALTTETAAVDRWLSFDPWGRRRNPNWSDPATLYSFGFEGGVGKELTETFTGHTGVDHLELVHMGGRMYDPVLGRVLSPDPLQPALDSTQGVNPYSYVANSPVSRTDPTGFYVGGIGGGDFNPGHGLGGGVGTIIQQFQSIPIYSGGSSNPNSSDDAAGFSFSFGVEFSASGLQRGVSDHSLQRVFGSFAEGAFSVFQLPFPTFSPLGHLNPNPLIIHFSTAMEPLPKATSNESQRIAFRIGLPPVPEPHRARDRPGALTEMLMDRYAANEAEIALALKSPKTLAAAAAAQRARVEAEQEAARRFANIRTGPGNSFLHAYWGALLGRRIDPDLGRRFLEAHERGGSDSADEQMRDLSNGYQGVGIGSASQGRTDEEIADRIFDEIQQGRLRWVQDDPRPGDFADVDLLWILRRR